MLYNYQRQCDPKPRLQIVARRDVQIPAEIGNNSRADAA